MGLGIGVSFTVDGLDAILSKLTDNSQKVRQFLNSEPKNLADQMVQEMQSTCPVDTGFLRDNIKAEEGEEQGRATVKSEAEYSIYVEFGTRFMSAQPYFFPAFDKYAGNISSIIDDFKSEVLTG